MQCNPLDTQIGDFLVCVKPFLEQTIFAQVIGFSYPVVPKGAARAALRERTHGLCSKFNGQRSQLLKSSVFNPFS